MQNEHRQTVGSILDAMFQPRTRLVENDESQNDRQALASGEVSTDDIIEKLNSIRAGRSFKDDNVAKAMEAYVKALDDAERTALFAFLKGIAQVVTGEIPADVATEPSDNPAGVEMSKDPKALKRSVRPNVIKKGAERKRAPSTAPGAPAPIQVKPQQG